MSINPHGEIPELRRRYRYLFAAVGLAFSVLLGRLWQMQIAQGADYLQKSTDNFVQARRIPTVRGVIFDRRGRQLVANRATYDVMVTPRFVSQATLERLAEELQLPPEAARAMQQSVLGVTGKKSYDPHLAARDISHDQRDRLKVHQDELPGVAVVDSARRNYLQGNLAAHVLGYLNEVNADEIARDRTYQPGDLVGRFGAERMYESALRGVAGREWVVVDARGRRKSGPEVADLLRNERTIEAQPGHNITLTIDLEVQRLTERALRNYPSGAAVVLEVNTGRVLASASKPAFEPNLLTGWVSADEARRLTTDPYRPLLDKVVRENYFPGSTYKVIPAIAALEEHQVNPEEKVNCKGAHSFGRRTFRCSHSHGKVDLSRAIVESCNVYFYNLAETVGMDTMAHYAHLFGLGAPTGIGLNGEVGGFIPTKDWYVRRKQPFRVGFTLNSAIGQGSVKATPLQIASLYATIANGGTLYLPQIVERVETSSGLIVQQFAPRVRRRVVLQPSTLALIRSSLEGVVADEKGTAHDSRLGEINVAGKTGTAQVNRRLDHGKIIWLEDHSWFASYAPAEAPQIAVAVLIEHGGRAAKVAAPVAMEIIRNYFKYVVAPNETRVQAKAGGGGAL